MAEAAWGCYSFQSQRDYSSRAMGIGTRHVEAMATYLVLSWHSWSYAPEVKTQPATRSAWMRLEGGMVDKEMPHQLRWLRTCQQSLPVTMAYKHWVTLLCATLAAASMPLEQQVGLALARCELGLTIVCCPGTVSVVRSKFSPVFSLTHALPCAVALQPRRPCYRRPFGF